MQYKHLLPTLYQFQRNELTILLKLCESDSGLAVTKLAALIKFQSRVDVNQLRDEDPAVLVIKRLLGDEAYQQFAALKRNAVRPSHHPLLTLLANSQSQFAKSFKPWIKQKKCSHSELDALYGVYVNYGVPGLESILAMAKKYGESFDRLREALQHGCNYLQCFTDNRFNVVIENVCSDTQSRYSAAEKEWFYTLLAKHAKAAGEFNLVELYDAFNTFLNKTREYGLTFYPSVDFDRVKNMKVAMGRMLTILERVDASERQTQWECITRLALGADGAIHAVKDNKTSKTVCHVVIPEMETVPVAYGLFKGKQYLAGGIPIQKGVGYQPATGLRTTFNLKSLEGDECYIAEDKRALREDFIDRELYRFVAHQHYRRPMCEYPDLVRIIKKANLKPEITILLYRILAYTSTSQKNSCDHQRMSRAEFKSWFAKTIKQISGIRLNVSLTATAETVLAPIRLIARAAGKSFMKDELDAPHDDYTLTDLMKWGTINMTVKSADDLPPIDGLYYLSRFVARGTKDISIRRLVSQDKNNMFAIFEDITDLDSPTQNALIRGLRFMSDHDNESVKECRAYVDLCKKMAAIRKEHYSYNAEALTQFKLGVMSIISTFNMRDELDEHFVVLVNDVAYMEQLCNLVFAVKLLADLDPTNHNSLTFKDFSQFIGDIRFAIDQPGYTSGRAIQMVKNRFGKYYPDNYFDRFINESRDKDLAKALSAIFKDKNNQLLCMDFLAPYQDPQYLQSIERLLVSLGYFADRLSTDEISGLINRLSAIANMHREAGDPPPALNQYCELLELIINRNQLGSFNFCVSNTLNAIDLNKSNQARLQVLQANYLAKIIHFIDKLSPDFSAESLHGLSEYELTAFTSKVLDETSFEDMADGQSIHPLNSIYEKLLSQVFSDEMIARALVNPEGYLEHLLAIEAQLSELSLIPEFENATQQLRSYINARKTYLAAKEAEFQAASNETTLQSASEKVQNALSAGSDMIKYAGSWLNRLIDNKSQRKPNPVIRTGDIPEMSSDSLVAARDAVTAKLTFSTTYAGMVAVIIDNIRLISSQYPAVSKAFINFAELFYSNAKQAGFSNAELVDQLTQLRRAMCAQNDENTVFALCLHFNNSTDDQLHAPADLMDIIVSDTFKQFSTEHRKILLGMLVKLLNNEIIHQLSDFNDFLAELANGDHHLAGKIDELYQKAPYPSLQQLTAWLKQPEKLSDHYDAFSLLPCRRECADDEPNGFKAELAKQKVSGFKGISFEDGELDYFEAETKRVRHLSIDDLLIELQALAADKSPERLIKLVALNAELLYRSKGTEPENEDPGNKEWGASFEINTTQYLAIYSMMKSGQHTTAEIATSEGKTRIMMILCACMHAMGKTVDFITSDLGLANREFTGFQSFFDLIGAESRMIYPDSPANHYAKHGINISDASSLELFRNRARSHGQENVVIDPDQTNRACLFDEADSGYFDLSDTRFNYSSANNDALRDIAWVYPLLMSFVQEKHPDRPDQYLYEELRLAETEDVVTVFNEYINGKLPDELKPRLEALETQQFQVWFEAAYKARDLHYQHDFVIDGDVPISTSGGPKVASEAKLIIADVKDPRSKYSFGVHQCLHARLNLLRTKVQGAAQPEPLSPLEQILATCKQPFHVEDEKQIIYSSSSKTLLNDYDHGAVYGVSGTAGSNDERAEASSLYAHRMSDDEADTVNMQFIEVPRHMGLKRIDKAVKLASNDDQTTKMVADEIIESRSNNQPVLIFLDDDAECKRVMSDVKAYLLRHGHSIDAMLSVDSTTSIQTEAKYIRQEVGKKNVVTFSTPRLSRGRDIKLEREVKNMTGLKVLTVGTIMRHRGYYQAVARAGRFGAPGESRIILNKQRIKAQLGKQTLTDGFYTSPLTYIRREQAKIDRQKQLERLIKLAYVDFRSNMQSSIYQSLMPHLSSSESSVMRSAWQRCSALLDQKWNTIFDDILAVLQSDPIQLDEINEHLNAMHGFTRSKWRELRNEILNQGSIKINDDLVRQHLMSEPPAFVLARDVVSIINKSALDEDMPKIRPIYDRYDSAHDGQAAIYRRPFEKLRATLRGERRLFADFRAWKEGRGILFANLRAWWRGDITLRALVLGGKGVAEIDENRNPQADSKMTRNAMMTDALGGVSVKPDTAMAAQHSPTASHPGNALFQQSQLTAESNVPNDIDRAYSAPCH